jgi:mannose/fructose/N-acetylgalactosamine-specific phosphotransferase system component IIB
MEKVATLKAEFVNELEFVPTKQRNRFSSEEVITHPYTSEYAATAAVKVGNAVKNIRIGEQHYHTPSFTDDNGNYHYGRYYKYFDLSDSSKKEFHTLTEAGIEIDFSEVYNQYFAQLEKAKQREEVIKRAKRIAAIRKGKEQYKKAWIHTFVDTIKSDKNKKIQAALSHTKFGKTTEKAFAVDNASLTIEVSYKGFLGYFHKNDRSFTFDGDSVYQFPEGKRTENAYNWKRSVADGKTRRAKREGTIFFKFIEAIDEYIAIKESTIKRKNKEEQERADHKKLLEDLTGYPIIIFEKSTYRSDYNRRGNGRYYTEYKYMIVTKQPTSKYSEPGGFTITTNVPRKYNSEKGEYEVVGERTFGVRGFSDLTLKQFKGIMEIALEGKEIFKEINYPKE